MDRKWIASTGTLIKIHRLEDPKSFDPYPQKNGTDHLFVPNRMTSSTRIAEVWSVPSTFQRLAWTRSIQEAQFYYRLSHHRKLEIHQTQRFPGRTVWIVSHIISCSCLVFPWSHRVSHHIYRILSYFKNFRTTETILRTAPNPILLRSAWQHHTARWDLRSDPVNGVLPVQGGAGTPIILKAQPEPHHKVTTKS